MSLRRKTFAAVRWTSLSMLARAALQFGKVIILARLLAPNDFGLMAMVLSVVAISRIVSELGISSAIIHHRDVTADELSSLFWLNIAVGLAFTLGFAALSPLIALFYGEPRLTPLLLIASFSFIAGAIGQQQRCVAQKELRFSQLASMEICSGVVGVVTAVVLALNGAGVYALSISTVLATIASSAFAWLFLSPNWRPSFHFRYAELKRFLDYGRNVVGVGLLTTLNMQADIIVAGRFFGGAALGLYSVPRDLCLRIQLMINPIVTRVGLPVMAAARTDLALVRNIYLQTVRMTASINLPIYAMLALFAPEIVHILYGPNWSASAELLRVLALAGLFRSINNPLGSLMHALGRTRQSLIAAICVTVTTFPALWIGAQFGIKGIAFANLALFAAAIPLYWRFVIWPACGAEFWRFHAQIAIPLATTTIAALVGYSTATLVEGDWARVIVGGASGGLAYLLASIILNRPWLDAAQELAFPRRSQAAS